MEIHLGLYFKRVTSKDSIASAPARKRYLVGQKGFFFWVTTAGSEEREKRNKKKRNGRKPLWKFFFVILDGRRLENTA